VSNVTSIAKSLAFNHRHNYIRPNDLTVWFHESCLALDADLRDLHGKTLKPTIKPINVENPVERWEAFNEVSAFAVGKIHHGNFCLACLPVSILK
jgi:hypothetical protein